MNFKNVIFDLLSKFKINDAVDQVPKNSSVYLFETRVYRTKNVKILPLLMKMQRNETILHSIIKSGFNKKNESDVIKNQKIFTINSFKLAKELRLVIGNERVQSSNLVMNLINQHNQKNEYEKNDYDDYILKVQSKHREFFFKSHVDKKEPLSKSYLQAAYFIKLVKNFNSHKTYDNI